MAAWPLGGTRLCSELLQHGRQVALPVDRLGDLCQEPRLFPRRLLRLDQLAPERRTRTPPHAPAQGDLTDIGAHGMGTADRLVEHAWAGARATAHVEQEGDLHREYLQRIQIELRE